MFTYFYLLNGNGLELFIMSKFIHYTLFYQEKNEYKF
jgi:hypothetical protein